MGVPYKQLPIPDGTGYREEQIHQASGLRIATVSCVLKTQLAGIQALTAFEDVAGAVGPGEPLMAADWVSMKVDADWHGRLPTPMTPAITLITTTSTAPGTINIRFRARGYDQFGATIVETTPWLAIATTSSSFYKIIYLSMVFSFLEDLEFQCDDVLGTGEFSVGWSAIIEPSKAEAATLSVSLAGAGASNTDVDIIAPTNWGIGTPLRVQPYGPDQPYATPEFLAGSGALLYSSHGPTFLGTPAIFPAATSTADGAVLGQNAIDWEGTPNKIGFIDANESGAIVLDIELGGSSQSASQTPATLAELGADALELNFTIRSTVGTRRGQRVTPKV